jgi:hypothetical protein
MKSQTNLLPWIVGGLSVATIAVVIAVASAGKTTVPSSPPAGTTTTQVTSVPDSPSSPASGPATAANIATEAAVPSVAAAPAAAPASRPDSETAQLPAAQAPAQPLAPAEPAVQSGQIWQCVTNGVKTFSNNPCGEKSTLLDVRAINTMNPTPVVHYARNYAPQPDSPAYDDQNTSDQDAYGEQGADNAVNSYTIVQGVAFLPRRRPDHPHHRPPHHHNPGDSPDHNPGNNPRHNMPRRN